MNTRFTVRMLGLLLAAGLMFGFVSLAPSSLGGTATWVSTTGISMEPDIHTGDLVIARPQASYEVGEVVAYPSENLEETAVLHRIVADGPEGLLTKGDNNEWLDPYQPRATEILGAQWLRIPGGGRMLALFTNPFLIAIVAVLLTSGGLFAARRTRRPGKRRAWAAQARRPRSSGTAFPDREWAAALGLAAIALAIFSFEQPAVSTASDQIDVQDTAQMSYSAPVHTAGVYAGDRIRTGDPVFMTVASAIDTQLDYQFGFDPGRVTGTISSTIRLAAGNGWERHIPYGAVEQITANRLQRSLPVDFAALLKLLHTAEQRAGTSFGGYTVEVIHHIDGTGTVAGQQVTTNSVPNLTFSLDDRQAVLQADSSPEAIGKPVTMTEASRVAVARPVPATVPVLRWDIPIKVLRTVAIGLGLASLVLAVLGLGLNRQPKSAFGSREVRASNIDFGDRSLVDVDDAAALAKLADLHDTVVLHLVQSHDDLFLVVVDQTVYRYAEPSTAGQESLVERRESARGTT